MTKLSDNFSDSELGVETAEPRIVENATFLCVTLLEPIRAHYNYPLRVHDGYRDPGHNSRVGGKPTSWHLLFTGSQAAADFDVLNVGLRRVF
jgi:zinc D-Ala-D-Ala carboxypeptidase